MVDLLPTVLTVQMLRVKLMLHGAGKQVVVIQVVEDFLKMELNMQAKQIFYLEELLVRLVLPQSILKQD